MARNKKLRRLVADGRLYLYSMKWNYDLDGERVVSVAIFHTHAETGPAPRPRGQPMRAKFLSSEPVGVVDVNAALPADVRAVLDRGLALGWDGQREGWLLPESGLERPGMVLSGPTRLREWAAGQPVFGLDFEDAALAERIAEDLGLPAVPAARGAREAQWRDKTRFLMRWRWGQWTHLHALSVAELVTALAAVARRAPRLGFGVGLLAGPGSDWRSGRPGQIVPSEHWATQPGARRYPGVRETDVVWIFDGPDGPRVEAYQYYPKPPDRLWRWVSLDAAGSVERRFSRV